MTPAGLVEFRVFDTADGLYDCAWSEASLTVVPGCALLALLMYFQAAQTWLG